MQEKQLLSIRRKKITNDDSSLVEPTTLLPIEEKRLSVDLTGFTPLELSRVALTNVFSGEEKLDDDDYVMYGWFDVDYKIASLADYLDLSRYTTEIYSDGTMIVGEKDQLADSNIKYQVQVKHDNGSDWLIPTIGIKDENEKIIQTDIIDLRHYDYR